MASISSLLGMILIPVLLSSGLIGVLPGSLAGQQDAAAQGEGKAKSAMERIGEEHIKSSAEQRHKENLAMGAPITGPYSADMEYSLTAEGSAIRTSDKVSSESGLSLDLLVWKSTETLVSMDIMNGTLQLGDEEVPVHSGHAYYLAYAHQVRVVAYIVEDIGDTRPGLHILVLKAKVDEGKLPFTGYSESLRVEILAPQSRLTPEWMVEMRGDLAFVASPEQTQKNKIVLTGILDYLGNEEILHSLISSAIEKLRERHPDLDIQFVEKTLPYPNERTELIASVNNNTTVDLFSADQIWLGELADMGLLTDLTNYTESWGRSSDWYQSNWDGGGYKGKTYGIWVWTDVRGIYYWKDLLAEADVDPDSLKTWDGYIASAEKLNAKLRPQGIEGVHLTGVGHAPDLWYPYLWMLGGEIVEQRSGHPTKGDYWFPSYNSTAGVEALTFIKNQVDAGIVPQTSHSWGQEFANKSFAVMMEASHVPSYFKPIQGEELEKMVGYIPMFPVPNDTVQTATLMGGWELTIPITSKHKELTWELISLMVEPDILAPWLAKYNYLPTQLPIGQGPYSQELREANPFFDEMASLIQYGRGRPSIPEYPQIADHIREAIFAVYFDGKDPKQALDEAAEKSAKALGWLD